ncbi:MAG: 4Fe-4S dicluster domain-containing protein [Planctomycetes bacterium]|nr:4Fe-4S dicluster domain-containing protein [Planctomycetota bacterium]
MTKVYNWQLGREMEYPYEAARPKRQFAAVFNINRCIACQTCTMACKSTWTFSKGQEFMWWNNVETKPFGGFPQSWDSKALQLLGPQPGWDTGSKAQDSPYGKYKGETLFEAAGKKIDASGQQALGYVPEDKEWRAPNFFEDTANRSPKTVNGVQEGAMLPEHQIFFFYLQRICNHCTYPACLAACPRKAIYKRPEDGIVLIDQSRCRGYRKCVEQCPYKKPMFNGQTRVSEKCIACYPRVEGKDPMSEGDPMVTRCISACVGKIRLQGWVDDPDSPVHYLVRKEKVALPLYPQFGTEPNVYYIPPRWAPRGYLHQMFGPGVDEAIAKYTKPSHELLAVLQLFGVTQKLINCYEVTADTIIAYGKEHKELMRVPINEAVLVRDEKYLNVT